MDTIRYGKLHFSLHNGNAKLREQKLHFFLKVTIFTSLKVFMMDKTMKMIAQKYSIFLEGLFSFSVYLKVTVAYVIILPA